MRTRVGSLAGVVLALLALAGCSGSTNSSRGAAPESEAAAASTTTTTALPTTSTTVAPTTTTTSTRPAAVVPRSADGLATVVRRGDTTRSGIALTFDAGSDGGNTADILDLLASRGLHASFGVTGKWIQANPALARRIVVEGHDVFNHTFDHQSFTGYSTNKGPLTRDQRTAELNDAATLIRTVMGIEPGPWFRPPYGDYDKSVQADVAAAGYPIVLMWSTDSLGWQGLEPASLVARVLGAAEPGAIILMHVGSASTDAAALPAILDGLRDRRLQPVTITELVGR